MGSFVVNTMNLSKEVYACAIQCGFDNCGIISMNALDGFDTLYQKRIKDVPQSKAFYDHVGLQGIKERLPWAKSIVILTYDYGRYCYPKEMRGKYAKAFFLDPGKNCGLGFDFQRFEHWLADHKIRAAGGSQFHATSVGPLRYIAAKAGLGIIRKNNFFYTENGSFTILLGYAIDQECELIQNTAVVPCSEKCDLCQRACKTGALQAPYTVNPLKCVSFLTTFGNSDVPQGLTPEMFEEWICGCDNCQDACPHNRRHDWDTGENFSILAELAPALLPENYEDLSDEFLIEQVISRTADHLKASDVQALRRNAKRALDYEQ